MFPKAWQAITFVGFILIMVIFIFDEDGQPVGVSNAVEAAERNAAEREAETAQAEGDDPASLPPAPQIEPETRDAPVGFADYQIEEYGTPQASTAPSLSTNPWGASEVQQSNPLPQGPPPPGARDPSQAPPRIIPQDPSDDPDLQADLKRALEAASR